MCSLRTYKGRLVIKQLILSSNLGPVKSVAVLAFYDLTSGCFLNIEVRDSQCF